MAKFKATVLYDYDPEVADELKLRVGDVLTNIQKIEDGWCQGVLNGKTGMFPDNFVKMEEDKTPPPKPPSTKKKVIESKRLMKATFAYDPQNADELELKMGDIVEIIKDEEEGWALGTLNGRKGVFPTNFCEPFTPSTDSTPISDKKEESNHHEPAQTAPPKKVPGGVGFGNIFGDGPIKLKKSVAGENKSASKQAHDDKQTAKVTHVDKPAYTPSHGEKLITKPAGHEKQTIKHSSEEKAALKPHGIKESTDKVPFGKKSKPVQKCRVTFDYDATTGDELDLKVGEIITIITKDCEDDGWWEGEKIDKDGKKHRGLFPDNFVILVPVEEPEVQEKSSVKETTEQSATEAKSKTITNAETEQNEIKEKAAAALASNHSIKKQAPQIPPASLKPEPEDSAASELDAVVDSTNDNHQLIHYRRVSGPKNRRRPDSTGRRERAKEAAEEAEVIPQLDSEPESPKLDGEPATPPQVAPKKETPRGIPVMPILGAGGEKAGEKPAWMKNLKRTSQKKEVPPKPEEAVKETPDWLANIRKKPKPVPLGEKVTSPVVPNKPGPGLTSPKPAAASSTTKTPVKSSTHSPLRPTSPGKPDEKPTAVARPAKKEVELKTAVHEAEESKAETKRPPLRPPTSSQHTTHPAEILKKPPAAATKPKPPPPSKAKPAVPLLKPQSSSAAVEELKEEMKALKDQLANFKKESMKEINRLSSEIDEERKKRMDLQSEVASLSKKLG